MDDLQQDVTPTDAGNVAELGGTEVENDVSSEATTGQESEQVTETQEQESPKKTPWFEKRIGEITREKYEERRQKEELRAEVERLRQAVAQGSDQYQADPQADVQTLARKEAEKLVAEQRFNDSCNKVYAVGKSEFQDFDQAVANLQMVGVNRQFLEMATESDAGAKLLHHLGTDLDEAARIMALPPIQMARELTKLEFKLNQPKAAKPVSNAPPPIKPIGTGKATSDGLSDDLPIDEWMRRNSGRK